jgi:hypothetical protein
VRLVFHQQIRRVAMAILWKRALMRRQEEEAVLKILR